MGRFECKVGEVILLKSPEPGKDWVGVITEFVEEKDDEEEDEVVKSANIMWFASPDEFMGTRNKRRTDALPNEQYITLDFNTNPLTSISGKGIVMSQNAFYKRYPNGPPKDKTNLAEYNKCIVCRRGVNQVQGRYTDEFVWEEVYNQDRIHDLIDLVKEGLKSSRKRRAADDDVSRNGQSRSKSCSTNKGSTVRRQQGDCSSQHPKKETTTGDRECYAAVTAQKGLDHPNPQTV
jgi:origin recognition complex subunit 1